jgi:hypothetical protein
MSSLPYFLIVAGPTGAGKGSLPDFITQYLNLGKKHTKILIDDLVVQNKYYKNAYDEWVLKNKFDVERVKKEMLNPSEDTVKFFNTIYFASRKHTDCMTGEVLNCTQNVPCEKTCDYQNDIALDTAIKQQKNIVFETTGIFFPDWLFEQYASFLENYQIIFAYPIVDVNTLLHRNKTRAESQVDAYYNSANVLPPRLPDIKEDKYRENLIKIIAIISSFLENQTTKCMANKIYCNVRVILVDNNDKQFVLYDNRDTSQFRKALCKYKVDDKC